LPCLPPASACKLRELGGGTCGHQVDASTCNGLEAFWRFIESLGRPVEVAVRDGSIATCGGLADTGLNDQLKVLAREPHRHHTD
jgi:hypothetical protein